MLKLGAGNVGVGDIAQRGVMGERSKEREALKIVRFLT